MSVNLKVRIGKLELANPVMVASGTFGYAEEFTELLDLRKIGAIVSKTLTLAGREGNPMPRTCETPCGMLNSIGLENPGIERFLEQKLPYLASLGSPIIVSVASENDPGEFTVMVKKLEKEPRVMAIELNISCPNIKRARDKGQGSGLIAQDPKATYTLVKSCRRLTRKTLITKLSPNVTCISEIALAAQAAGSDAVSLVNTFTGMSIDVQAKRPKIACVVGGLSGPAIRPIALRMVWEVFQKIRIPIIGMGGIMDAQSALEFFLAGSSAISVGTANFVNPRVSLEIVRGIRGYLDKNRIKDIRSIVGALKI